VARREAGTRRFMPKAGVVSLLAVASLAALAGTARAELCDPATRICIVNPPTAASPWLASQLVQLRLPAESNPAYSGASWTQPGVPEAEYPHGLESGRYPIKGKLQLVEQGAPGGTSLYQGMIEPGFDSERPGNNLFLPVDGTLTLSVRSARADPGCECIKEDIATFAGLPVMSPVARFNWRLIRSGKWFLATMSLEARTPLRVSQILYVSGFDRKGYDFFPLPLMKRQLTGSGPLRIVQKLSARYVHNKCSDYQRCTLYVDGEMGSAVESRLEDGHLSSLSRPIVIRRR
jgi:hypothetical protein